MKASKKILALLLSAALGLSLLAGCGNGGNTGSINSGEVNEDGVIIVANSPDEVVVNSADLVPLAEATDISFNCETLEYSFNGVEGADYYYIRVFPVENGEQSNSASFQSDKIDAVESGSYSGVITGQTLLAGEYNIYIVASGSGYISSEAMISGSSTLLAAASVSANWDTGTDEDPTVTAKITITPGDDIAKTFTLVITDEAGNVVYTNENATAEPIVITAEDLGVEALSVEDVYNVSVSVNEISGYKLPAEPTNGTITEQRGSGGPGGPGGS